jgi:hypothetical protein
MTVPSWPALGAVKCVSCALALFALAAATPASAVIISTSYEFSATFVTPAGQVPLPFSSISGTFTLAYDNANSNNSTNITLAALNLSFNGIQFDTSNSGKQFLFPATNPKTLQIGGSLNGFGGLAQNTNDFRLTYTYLPDYTDISPLTGAFPNKELVVTVQGRSGIRTASNLKVTAIPEPAAWALMVTGFGLVGAAFRHRRRRASLPS